MYEALRAVWTQSGARVWLTPQGKTQNLYDVRAPEKRHFSAASPHVGG